MFFLFLIMIFILPKNSTSQGLFAHQVPHTVKHCSKNASVRAPKRSKYPESTSSRSIFGLSFALSS